MKSPYFLIDEGLIEKNLQVLAHVRAQTGCKILLAQKAFSCFDVYPLIARYLDGTTASGLFEARLGKEKFVRNSPSRVKGCPDRGGVVETHVFAPAFTDDDIQQIVKICDHIVFNSVAQLLKHYDICKKHNLSIGLRINPEFRTQTSDIYDPCAPLSRFGVTLADFKRHEKEIMARIDGLHFHTLCEQGFEPLRETVRAFENKFGKYIAGLKWVNFGGGHHITADGYDVAGLVNLVNDFKKRHNVQVYLEPGEAVVLNAGTLIATVLDIVHNQRDIAILDTSAACHNPDILETGHAYTPSIQSPPATRGGDKYLYRLSGNTCLAGDIIGDYSFNKPLQVGDTVTFTNMALYTIVKTNMFNGINLPSIYIKRLSSPPRRGGEDVKIRPTTKIELLRAFGYDDYKTRLGK